MAATGRQRVRNALAAARPLTIVSDNEGESIHGLPPGCPVVPLGVAGEVRYYLDAKRQIIALTAGDHTRLKLLGLFVPQAEFCYATDRWTRKNDKGVVTGLRPELIAEDLMTACGHAGVWDPSDRERGRGTWLGENGELVMHLGDEVLFFERIPDPWGGRMARKPGLAGRYVYPSGDRAGAPVEQVGDDSPGEELLELFDTWAWRRNDLDAVLMLGWVGAAMIGGALPWRPVVWLTGGKGTGKSTLLKALKGLFGNALIDLADTSPAFIWQTLRHQTLPVSVDELEADEDNRKQMNVVRLARIAASGGKLGRGSDKHVPVEFTLRSCFLFSSVLVPPLMGPDRSRIAMLELADLPPEQIAPDLEPRALKHLGARLRRRMIDGWPRFDATLERYRRALATVGHSQRGADQFGTLLTCADLLLFGDQPDAQAADEWVRRLAAAGLSETADDLRDEEQCLQHMLASQVDAFRAGERLLLGEWINRAAGRMPNVDAGEAERVIGRVGIRLEKIDRTAYLAIANNHTGLAGLFQRTRWQTPQGVTGVWVQAMRRLPGAERGTRTLYFGGAYGKATLIPLSLIPPPDLQLELPITDPEV